MESDGNDPSSPRMLVSLGVVRYETRLVPKVVVGIPPVTHFRDEQEEEEEEEEEEVDPVEERERKGEALSSRSPASS